MNSYEINLNAQDINGQMLKVNIQADEYSLNDNDVFIEFWNEDNEDDPIALFKKDLVVSIIRTNESVVQS